MAVTVLDKGKKSPEELSIKSKAISERLQEKNNKEWKTAIEKIDSFSDIPKEFENQKNAKSLIENFKSFVSNSKFETNQTLIWRSIIGNIKIF